MEFVEISDDGSNLVQAYGPAGIRVGGRDYTGALILSPDHIESSWAPPAAQALRTSDFTPLLDLRPQLILLGTGQALVFPEPAEYAPILAQGIGIEIMDTGAACRTYNILLSEGRRVVAGLLPILDLP